MQPRLSQFEIDAQPEGTYADGKRSDIRVAYRDFNVPVKIKRSRHPDVWSAIANQLVGKYTRDPGAEGFGIYRVFWFGPDNRCKPTGLDGRVPANARELESRLAEHLPDSERSRITVCVVDVRKQEQ